MFEVFKVCFYVGLSVTGLNALLSLVFGIFDFGIDFDIDFDLFDIDIGAFLPLSPTLIFLFLTVFGGSGMVLSEPFSAKLWLALILALLIAFAIIFLINACVVRPLRKISAKETVAESDFVGMTGKVTEKIYEGSFGKVTIICDGNTITGPAKSANGNEICVGTEIFIESIDSKVFIVDLLEKEANL